MKLIEKFNFNTGLHIVNNNGGKKKSALFDLPKLKTLHSDVISFKAKNYDISSIKSQTNHCAYCGVKVYTQRQLEVLATELMQLKGNNLQGKIRSIEEKLGGKSENALIQKKREVNKENIDFFETFTEEVRKNPTKAGVEILTEKFALKEDDVPKFLLNKISPLLKTVDHVVPQNLDVDNDNNELNLVESCFTCNSKIKNGSTFRSFYFTYPSIKDNMPKEKFEFASLGILETSPDVIVSRMDAEELVRVFDGLFIQKQNIQSALFAVEEKIKNCVNSIRATIDKIAGERSTKEDEIRQLEEQNKLHSEDEEYNALLNRKNLISSIDLLKEKVTDLSATSSRYSKNIQTWKNKLNEIGDNKTHGKKKSKHQSYDSSEKDELQRKISDGEKNLKAVVDERKKVEAELKRKEEELSSLNEQYPDIDSLRAEKSKLEVLLNSHSQISQGKQKLSEIQSVIANLKVKSAENEEAQKRLRVQIPVTENLPQSVEEDYQRYIDLSTALKEAEKGILSKDKSVRMIAEMVKPQLENGIKELESNPFVRKHVITQKADELKAEEEIIKNDLKNAYTQKNTLEAQLVQNIERIREYVRSDEDGENSKLSEFSLIDLNNRIESLTNIKNKYEIELAMLPENKLTEEYDKDSDTFKEYNRLLLRADELKNELLKQMPRRERDIMKAELEEISMQILSLCDEDGNVFQNHNLKRLDDLEAHLEQLEKGLQNSSSPKAKASHSKQIKEINDEIEELAETDSLVFNILNDRKRDKLIEKIDRLTSQLDSVCAQRDEFERTLSLKGNISDGFSVRDTEEKINLIEEKIKRLNQKSNWLEVSDRIKKINTEIKIQNENINSLENKLHSIEENI